MKPRILALSLLFVCISAVRALALESGTVIGNYELQGVMEMAGGLSLKPGGKYLAGFSYGAADWVEEGTWKVEGEEVVLSGGRFKQRNYGKMPLFLPPGTRFKFQAGKLSASDPERNIVFLDPNKTPAGKGKEAGEGRMRVKGRVVRLDPEYLMVDVDGECMQFDSSSLSEAVLRKVQGKVGKSIDVEIPYSAIRSSGSCS